ncbi:MAG: lipid A deacylase LpxR family protein, partial [Gammaproteobacteria bacterium]|nr:lipid A deacylase LpxR family protein [Gammaproteobacteria bacterium]
SPKGWDNQLKNELTLGVSYSRLFRWFEPLSEGLMVGLNRHDSVALGNAYTYLSSGVMLRFGKNLKRDLSPPTISPGFPGLPYFQAVKESNWYIYGGLEGRLVIRDIFLDGNTFADSHSVDKEVFVADAQIGFVYMYSDFRIAISKMFRTEEFKTQQKNESFGEINFSYQY